MPLNIGNATATTGMTKVIYDKMDKLLRPPMEASKVKAEAIQESQEAWKTLSLAIATGVVNHLLRDPATETEYAEMFSSSAEDAAFWSWLAGFVNVFKIWADNPAGDIVLLRTSLRNFLAANSTPDQLKGVVR